MTVEAGNIYKLPNSDRKVIVGFFIHILHWKFAVVYLLSSAVYLAAEDDFILASEECFGRLPMMAESWNSLAVPVEFLTDFQGKLSESYLKMLSTFVYHQHQRAKHSKLMTLTGPPIRSNSDIRKRFRADEAFALADLRQQLIDQQSKSE